MSQSVERAIQILEMLSEGPQHVQAIADRLGIHRTTAFRLTQDLCSGGLARRNGDGSYAVGFRLAGLAQAALEQFDLRGIAHRHLVELSAKLRATVHLGAADGDRIVYVDKVESRGTVRLYSEIGKPVLLHASGVGKAILAFMPPNERDRLLDGYTFQRFTPTTITMPQEFAGHLAAVRQQGWARDDGEHESWINCVAVPVRDGTREIRTGLSVTTLRAQTDLQQLESMLPIILSAAEDISRDLGWTG
jgi:DNA-binding IclR family transcriptional regulator